MPSRYTSKYRYGTGWCDGRLGRTRELTTVGSEAAVGQQSLGQTDHTRRAMISVPFFFTELLLNGGPPKLGNCVPDIARF